MSREIPALSLIEVGYPITAENNLECILCPFQAMGRTKHSLFLEHMKESHARGPISWVCKICNNFRSAAPGSVGAHTRQCKILYVSAYREILSKIEEGNKTFSVLNEAAVTYAGGISPAVCPSCDVKVLGLGQFNALEIHLKVCHLAKSISYTCALCKTRSTRSIYSARSHYLQCFKRVKIKDAGTGVTTSEAQEKKDGLFYAMATGSEHIDNTSYHAANTSIAAFPDHTHCTQHIAKTKDRLDDSSHRPAASLSQNAAPSMHNTPLTARERAYSSALIAPTGLGSCHRQPRRSSVSPERCELVEVPDSRASFVQNDHNPKDEESKSVDAELSNKVTLSTTSTRHATEARTHNNAFISSSIPGKPDQPSNKPSVVPRFHELAETREDTFSFQSHGSANNNRDLTELGSATT
ncbi:hypothetical protein ACOME3_000006 [Neoechinorhynchus agilis]